MTRESHSYYRTSTGFDALYIMRSIEWWCFRSVSHKSVTNLWSVHKLRY